MDNNFFNNFFDNFGNQFMGTTIFDEQGNQYFRQYSYDQFNNIIWGNFFFDVNGNAFTGTTFFDENGIQFFFYDNTNYNNNDYIATEDNSYSNDISNSNYYNNSITNNENRSQNFNTNINYNEPNFNENHKDFNNNSNEFEVAFNTKTTLDNIVENYNNTTNTFDNINSTLNNISNENETTINSSNNSKTSSETKSTLKNNKNDVIKENSPKQKKKKSFIFKLLMTIFILLLLGGASYGGYFAYNKYYKKQPEISMNDYKVTPVAVGIEGEGKPQVDIEIPQIKNSNKTTEKNKEEIEKFLKDVNKTYSKDSGLKSGDKITVTLSLDNNKAKELGLTITGEWKKELTYSGFSVKVPDNNSTTVSSDDEKKVKSFMKEYINAMMRSIQNKNTEVIDYYTPTSKSGEDDKKWLTTGISHIDYYTLDTQDIKSIKKNNNSSYTVETHDEFTVHFKSGSSEKAIRNKTFDIIEKDGKLYISEHKIDYVKN